MQRNMLDTQSLPNTIETTFQTLPPSVSRPTAEKRISSATRLPQKGRARKEAKKLVCHQYSE